MTEKTRATVNEEMMARPCGFCDAAVGEWCITKGGFRASYLHAERWWAWKDSQAEKHTEERGTT